MRHRQSHAHSVIESTINISVGYVIALTTQATLFPLLGVPLDLSQNLIIVTVFTVVSFARSYALRKVFNWWMVRA